VAWGGRIAVLLCIALLPDGGLLVWVLFMLYAAVLAMSEAAERAIIGDQAPKNLKATAFGLYHLSSGMMALPGTLVFGLIWQYISMTAAFATAVVLTAIAAALFLSTSSSARS